MFHVIYIALQIGNELRSLGVPFSPYKLKGRRKLRYLWCDQEGKCPNCNQKITKDTGWNMHHILPKSEDGKDNLSNLVLVNPNCHKQVHCRKTNFVPPTPTKGP